MSTEHAPRPRARPVREASETELQRRMQLPAAQTIVKVTRKIVEQNGLDAASMREISRRAGLGGYSAHYYFGSKGRLLLEVVGAERVQRMGQLRDALEAATSREQVLGAIEDLLRRSLDRDRLAVSLELDAELSWRARADRRLEELRGGLRRADREELAELLGDKERAGVIRLREPASTVSEILLCLVSGVENEIAVDRGWRYERAVGEIRKLATMLILTPEQD